MATRDPDDVREQVLTATFTSVARVGMAKTTVEGVARTSGVSRATIYRHFPGGRDELLAETVAWEMGRFFLRLAEAVGDAPDFVTLVEDGLMFARTSVRDHEVLQKMLITEPETLLPLMTTQSHRTLEWIQMYLQPFVEREAAAGRLRPGVEVDPAVDYVARMILSLISSPGRWNLDDRAEVETLVRCELLGGILREEFLPGAGVCIDEMDRVAGPAGGDRVE
ncbi:MAG: TetR/AcrR family transcriptional regulator [Acidimicrobiia bacterium]|nr:TetR/AcrR family transcriptional regulator [Acidimicrobiia bacterium]